MDNVCKLEKQLGIGAHGVVYLGYDDAIGRFVAVKEIAYHDGGSGTPEETASKILQEIRVMQHCNHPNLVAYYGARRSAVGVQIIMEYMGGGSVEGLLKAHGKLSESVVRRYTASILRGLCYLHNARHVCHRDVKPANVMLTPDGECKLIDFGISKTFTAEEDVEERFMQTTCGTPWYMAPEVIGGGEPDEDSDDDYYDPLRGVSYRGHDGDIETHTAQRIHKRGYTYSADVWSLGVVVYEMVSGVKPFGADLVNPTAVLFNIINSAAHPPRLPETCKVSAELHSFLGLCFVYDKSLRPSAAELLGHPWITAGEGDTVPQVLRSALSVEPSQSMPAMRGGTTTTSTSRNAVSTTRGAASLLDAADLPSQHLHTTHYTSPPSNDEDGDALGSFGYASPLPLPNDHTREGNRINNSINNNTNTTSSGGALADRGVNEPYNQVRQRIEAAAEGRRRRQSRHAGDGGAGNTSVCSSAGSVLTTSDISGFLSKDGHFVDIVCSQPRDYHHSGGGQ